MDCLASSGVKASGGGKPLPLDFSHHYSEVTKRRVPSEIKRAYELFKIPGIRNLSGGLSPLSLLIPQLVVTFLGAHFLDSRPPEPPVFPL